MKGVLGILRDIIQSYTFSLIDLLVRYRLGNYLPRCIRNFYLRYQYKLCRNDGIVDCGFYAGYLVVRYNTWKEKW